MLIKTKILKTTVFTLLFLLLIACADKDPDAALNKQAAEEITWENLIPEAYNPEDVIKEYQDSLSDIEDPNLKAEMMLGTFALQSKLDNAPVNTSLEGKKIRMPGFIAPLEHNDGIISEFLLVPYAGACIHTPAPPVNQTVMIKSAKGKGVASRDVFRPVWVTGHLKIVKEETKIGNAGYRIDNAKVDLYTDEQ